MSSFTVNTKEFNSPSKMWPLNWFSLFVIITIQYSHLSNAASDLYAQPGRNVTIPCLLNIPKSNIGSLYWQKITNSTQGFETLYSFIKFANGLGWQSPLQGYVANFTDLVLLNVTFSHDGVYICKISTHNQPQIVERKTYLHVILPLLDIEVRKNKAGTVINNGDTIQLLHGEETDVECAVVGNVSPPVELGWVTSEDHNQTVVSTSLPHGPSISVKLNGSRVTHKENITCRAVQWIAGLPYLTIESTFILKRLIPLLEIEVRKCKAGTVINNGEIIHLLHDEETDVECAVVGNVSPPVELRWVISEDHKQTFVSTLLDHDPSSSIKLNGSLITHEKNITCRAVQWIEGRPYLTIESTFILKRLIPLLEIEVRKSKAGTVINNGEIIQVLHGEITDVECAVVGNVSPVVELQWLTSENHNQTFVSTSLHHGPSSSVKLNGSRVTHEENITCRAVQWIAERPYLTIESTFILKRLIPLLEIEIRKSKAGTVINNGDIIQVLHGEITDVDCAVVGNVSPPVELRWVTSEDHIQPYVSTPLDHDPSISVKLNGSRVTHEENITCRAVQWIAGRPCLTIESTFILKRLHPRIDILNCTAQVDSQPGDCCLIEVPSNLSTNSIFVLNLTCEAKNTVSPVNLTWFHQLGNQLKEIETRVGYAISAVPDPGYMNSSWTCSLKDREGETWNISACLYTNSPPGRYRNVHPHAETIAATCTSLLVLLAIISFIVFIIRRKKGNNKDGDHNMDNHDEHTPMVSLVGLHAVDESSNTVPNSSDYPDSDYRSRAGPLLNKPKPTTPDASMEQKSSSFPIQQCRNEDVLRALAVDITTDDQLKKPGLELSFKESDINGFEAMNHRTTAPSMKDIRNVKIAKNFTVSDCREKLVMHYRMEACNIRKKREFWNSGNHLPALGIHSIVERGKNLYVNKTPLLEGSFNEMLRTTKGGALPTRIVIFGPSGIGKSTLVAQMAHEWAERVQGSLLQDVSLFFVLKMKFVDNHGSLGQAIVNQLLSDVRGLTSQGINQLITDNQSECMLVLDGLEGFRGEISSIKCGHVMRVVQNIQQMKCRIIVTSHPRLEDYFNKEDLPNDFLKIELQGLSKVQSTSFIRSFFRENHLHTANELIAFLEMNDVINELLATPLFCLLACHLWECNLLQLVTTESEFYDSINRFFLEHGEEKASTSSVDTDLQMIVQGIGEVVLNGFLADPNKQAIGQRDFRKCSATLQKAISLGIICKTTPKKRDDTGIEFHHHNVQEHSVAQYLSKEVTSKLATGKHSRLDKALKHMATKNLADFGRVLRFIAGIGSPSTGLQVIEAIHSANRVPLGDKTRMILDCLAEIPQLDKQTTYAVERCFAGGNVFINLPTIHTTIGFYKLPPFVKEKVQSVTIQSSSMPSHVAKRLSMGLQGYPDLVKLEVADVHNPTYPIILLLLNKLSIHLAPEGALSIIPNLNQSIFNGLRLVDLSGCYISPEMTSVLWTALARCPNIEVMTIKNSTILSRNLPRLGCIAALQANFLSPVLPEEVGWLSSIVGGAEYSTEVRLAIGDGEDGTIRRAGLGVQEHILMVDDRIVLTNVTGNTIKVLNVLPDSYRRKVRTLCINRTRFIDDLTRPLLNFVHSLIHLETFTTEDRNIPEEIKQFQVLKGTFKRPVNELPIMGRDGVLKGSVSSPLQEEEVERLNSAFSSTTTMQQVHIIIERYRRSETDFQELLDITGDSMELCNVSSVTIEILKMFPASFRQKMHSARIKNCNLTDDLSQQLSETLQSMDELEMFFSENSALGQKALHLKTVTVLDLGRLSSTCYDWEWLDSAELLEELHLTFASSPTPTKPTTPITSSTPKGATSTPFPASSPMYENIPEREDDAAAVRLSGEEDFHLHLSFGRLVVTRMSSCSMAVMLHLPKHLKDELRHVRIRSTKLTEDVVNRLADVRLSFKHLSPLSLQALYRGPVKFGCKLQPGALHPVVGQGD